MADAFHLLQEEEEEEEEYLSFNKCLAAVSSHLLPVCRLLLLSFTSFTLVSFTAPPPLVATHPHSTVMCTHTHTIDERERAAAGRGDIVCAASTRV